MDKTAFVDAELIAFDSCISRLPAVSLKTRDALIFASVITLGFGAAWPGYFDLTRQPVTTKVIESKISHDNPEYMKEMCDIFQCGSHAGLDGRSLQVEIPQRRPMVSLVSSEAPFIHSPSQAKRPRGAADPANANKQDLLDKAIVLINEITLGEVA